MIWPVAAVGLLLLLLGSSATIIATVVPPLAVRAGHPLSEVELGVLRVATVFLQSFTKVPSILFQMVVWGATRPAMAVSTQQTGQ